MTLGELLDGPRPGRDDPERDRVWLDVQRDIGRAACGHPVFDLRLGLIAGPEWHQRRRAWLAAIFRDDPRVVVTP